MLVNAGAKPVVARSPSSAWVGILRYVFLRHVIQPGSLGLGFRLYRAGFDVDSTCALIQTTTQVSAKWYIHSLLPLLPFPFRVFHKETDRHDCQTRILLLESRGARFGSRDRLAGANALRPSALPILPSIPER